MDSSTQTSEGDIKLNSDLFDLAEKLQIQLQVKDKELEKEKQEKQELSANLDLSMTRANRTDALETELASAQQIIYVLQMSLWKYFPSPDLSYHIKTQSGSHNGQFLYLYTEYNRCGTVTNYYLRTTASELSGSKFKITKNSDGSFSFYTMGKYLQTDTSSSRVYFAGDNGNTGKFVLFFHQQQNQQAGLLVDISSMDGYFLCYKNNCVMANSRTQPANKFLIIPVGLR